MKLRRSIFPLFLAPDPSAWTKFLKANSSIIGPSQNVVIRHPDRRTDEEVELAVVIGRRAQAVPAA